MKKISILFLAITTALLFQGCGSTLPERLSAVITQETDAVPEEQAQQSSSDTGADKTGAGYDEEQPDLPDVVPETPGEPYNPDDSPESSGSAPSAEEVELLSDDSLTAGDLKALNYSNLKSQAAVLVSQFLDNNIPKNVYSNLSFHHDGSLLSYDDPDFSYQLGIDVSVFQGEIDWNAVKEQGISFAIIRAGYRGYGESGSLNEDEMFRQNVEGAREAGLLVGAYFFSQALNSEEAREEANYVLSLLDGISLDLPLVFDEEIIRDDDARTDAVPLHQFTENALAFFGVIRDAGYTPMLYTNLLSELLIFDLEQFSGIPVWFAGYEPLPLSPYHFDIWQYTESGTLNGIEGPVDLNIWIQKN